MISNLQTKLNENKNEITILLDTSSRMSAIFTDHVTRRGCGHQYMSMAKYIIAGMTRIANTFGQKIRVFEFGDELLEIPINSFFDESNLIRLNLTLNSQKLKIAISDLQKLGLEGNVFLISNSTYERDANVASSSEFEPNLSVPINTICIGNQKSLYKVAKLTGGEFLHAPTYELIAGTISSFLICSEKKRFSFPDLAKLNMGQFFEIITNELKLANFLGDYPISQEDFRKDINNLMLWTFDYQNIEHGHLYRQFLTDCYRNGRIANHLMIGNDESFQAKIIEFMTFFEDFRKINFSMIQSYVAPELRHCDYRFVNENCRVLMSDENIMPIREIMPGDIISTGIVLSVIKIVQKIRMVRVDNLICTGFCPIKSQDLETNWVYAINETSNNNLTFEVGYNLVVQNSDHMICEGKKCATIGFSPITSIESEEEIYQHPFYNGEILEQIGNYIWNTVIITEMSISADEHHRILNFTV